MVGQGRDAREFHNRYTGAARARLAGGGSESGQYSLNVNVPSNMKLKFKLRMSQNRKLIQRGGLFGGVLGVMAAFLFTANILQFFGIAATSVALFCCPIALVAAGALAMIGVALFCFGRSSKKMQYDQAGTNLTLASKSEHGAGKDHTISLEADDNFAKARHSIAGQSDALVANVKLSVARFARGGILGGFLGAAGALAAGWYFTCPILLTLGAVAYPLVLLGLGAVVGSLLIGSIATVVGRGCDKAFGWDQSWTYRGGWSCLKIDSASYSKQRASSSELTPQDCVFDKTLLEFKGARRRVAADVSGLKISSRAAAAVV
jgi:hypothetical protein